MTKVDTAQFEFVLNVRVEDQRKLFTAAKAHLLAHGGTTHDIEMFLGTEASPRIDRCLVELLDSRRLPGCLIENSGARQVLGL
jgi:hypothetical protein